MSDSSSSDGEESWITWFCGLVGHEMFCEVERSYIEDSFNLYGLRSYVPLINECLDVILDRVGPDESSEDVLQASYALYGLIHARYIVTTNGLEAMHKKHYLLDFGSCPRWLCRGAPVIPLGIRDEPKIEGVKVYCPSCQDVYNPWNPAPSSSTLDGAYFGTTFAHLFCMTYEHATPAQAREDYVPRIFGFRVRPRGAPGPAAIGTGAVAATNTGAGPAASSGTGQGQAAGGTQSGGGGSGRRRGSGKDNQEKDNGKDGRDKDSVIENNKHRSGDGGAGGSAAGGSLKDGARSSTTKATTSAAASSGTGAGGGNGAGIGDQNANSSNTNTSGATTNGARRQTGSKRAADDQGSGNNSGAGSIGMPATKTRRK